MPHVVVLPYPAQGHMNPLMEFAKRLVSKNLRVTFVTTETARERMVQAQNDDGASRLHDIRIETISDGLSPDIDRRNEELVVDLLRKNGGLSFENLIERLNAEDEIVSCIVYDSFLEWVPEIATKFHIPCAFLWTQSCAVYSICYHYHKELAKEEDETKKAMNVLKVIPGLPHLRPSDLPSFLQPSNPDRSFVQFLLQQFTTISQATWILGNSFNELETTEIESMNSPIRITTVGPLVSSAFLDGNHPQDTDVGVDLSKVTNCIDWLNAQADSTLVYVSFGSYTTLSKEQIHEIALGLKASRRSFLWVIRHGDNNKENNSAQEFPEGFLEETAGRGLVVPWCPQMAVLSHPSVGLFMTHRGWNSTLESLISGIPLLAVPQWIDQPTNSKYIEEEWKTGIRLNRREDVLIGREEVANSIKEVMESEEGVELRKNALRWKTLAKQAMGKGGSSDKNRWRFSLEGIINVVWKHK